MIRGECLEEEWDALVAVALDAGLSLVEFWQSTPREIKLIADSRNRRERHWALFLAWHSIALMRTEMLPSLEELLAPPKNETELEKDRQIQAREFSELVSARERQRPEGQQ